MRELAKQGSASLQDSRSFARPCSTELRWRGWSCPQNCSPSKECGSRQFGQSTCTPEVHRLPPPVKAKREPWILQGCHHGPENFCREDTDLTDQQARLDVWPIAPRGRHQHVVQHTWCTSLMIDPTRWCAFIVLLAQNRTRFNTRTEAHSLNA